MPFSVRVTAPELKFNSAHFVAYRGFRERLHGHTYTMTVRIDGDALGANGYVTDFGIMKRVAKAICSELNERFLCAMLSDTVTVNDIDGQV